MKPAEYYKHYNQLFNEYLKNVDNSNVGNYEKKAVQRFLNCKTKYRFDEKEFEKKLKFFSLLNIQSKNNISQIQLATWQILVLAQYCLYYPDSSQRVIETIVVSTAGKNGKSSFVCGLALLGSLADNQLNSNIAVVSPTNKQSGEILKYVKQMIQYSPLLTGLFKVNHSTIINKQELSTNTILTLTAEVEKIQGTNLSSIILDEWFLYDKEMFDIKNIAKNKMSTRENTISFLVGTFQDQTAYTYENFYLPCLNILNGHVEDDSMFILFCQQDSVKEVEDPSTWIKSNPSIGLTKNLKQLISDYEKTKIFPASLNSFLQDSLNYWTERAPDELFFEDETVKELMQDVQPIPSGSSVTIGLDMSSNRDLTAITLLWENPKTGTFTSKMINVMPNVLKNFKKSNVNLQKWFVEDLEQFAANNYMINENGHCVIPSAKRVMDEELIFEIINDLSKKYEIKQIGYDKFNAQKLISKLEDSGFNCVDVPQNILAQNFPIKYLEQLIYNDQFKVEPNPCSRWQASNIVLYSDINGNVKFDKRKGLSIDSWAALVSCFYLYVSDETNRFAKKLDAFL